MSRHTIHRWVTTGECYANIALISCTGFHEWGNPVGYACVPLIVVLVIHLFCQE